jgi:hypothetical protein
MARCVGEAQYSLIEAQTRFFVQTKWNRFHLQDSGQIPQLERISAFLLANDGIGSII